MKTQITCEDFHGALTQNNIEYYCGVPDSLISPLSFYLEDTAKGSHTIAANEGNAIGLAIGYHVATKKIPLVYMQNSGLGNAIDPLVSLADPTVFSTPMLLLISWRGQPGTKDEPQHSKQGAITPDLLRTLGIPYQVISRSKEQMISQVSEAATDARQHGRPYALLVEKDLFVGYKKSASPAIEFPLTREQALTVIMDAIEPSAAVVASIGKMSREIFEYREAKEAGHDNDLLIVGGMGHASSIALGIAQQKTDKKIYCLDGDGSLIMHLGALTTIGRESPKNFYHIILNNGAHDSVGGQPTAGLDIRIPKIAKACNYKTTVTVRDALELKEMIRKTNRLTGPILIEVLVRSGARDDLTRPTIHPHHNKESFSTFLNTSPSGSHS